MSSCCSGAVLFVELAIGVGIGISVEASSFIVARFNQEAWPGLWVGLVY